ncbi:MAG: hypothetical protein JO094_14680 [Hyphomicrobiales bacterium]|nr:hypothetical protein [Hyphomicrobiales bacterium]MBV9978381.1 hypothetical protein [Hyphomicrobiales bacterium]
MAEIAEEIGRLVCRAIDTLVPQCQSGQSVANIGYGAVALILLSLGVSKFLGRAGG